MATRELTLHEVSELGRGVMIICDHCERAIDKLGVVGTFWRDEYERQALYASRPTLCFACKEKADIIKEGI